MCERSGKVKFNAFMRGVGQVFSLCPARRPRLLIKPPKIMTDEQAIAHDWNMVLPVAPVADVRRNRGRRRL